MKNTTINSQKANFGIDGSVIEDFIHDIDTSNKIHGRPIYYWVGETDRVVPSDASFVGLVECMNVTAKELNLTDDNNRGILLAYSTNCTVENNHLVNNWWALTAIKSSNNTFINNNVTNNFIGFVSQSSMNTLRNNTVAKNSYGFDLFNSADIIDSNMICDSENIGIYLDSSSNSVIKNNIIGGNEWSGIRVEDSDNNTIANNNITKNLLSGIDLATSDNNALFNNTITNNTAGIFVRYSEKNLLKSNEIIDNMHVDVYLEYSGYNTFIANNMTSFDIYGYILEDFIENIDTTNTVKGKPMYYLVNEQNHQINPQEYPNIGFLAIVNSTNITVSDVTIEENSQGVLFAYTDKSSIKNITLVRNNIAIKLDHSSNNFISNNNMTENFFGVMFSMSANNTIIDNDIEKSEYGIVLDRSNSNEIQSNTLLDNDIIGIDLGSSDNNRIINNHVFKTIQKITGGIGIRVYSSKGNIIYLNNIINYKEDAKIIESYTNTWDNGRLGNYWSDYNGTDTNGDGIGDTPYTIDVNNQDRYPLMKPVVFSKILGDLNKDGVVDIFDIVLACMSYSAKQGEPNWNPDVDLAPEFGLIDIYDIVTIAAQYGETT
jgi:parallel beta-helix repeat protein